MRCIMFMVFVNLTDEVSATWTTLVLMSAYFYGQKSYSLFVLTMYKCL